MDSEVVENSKFKKQRDVIIIEEKELLSQKDLYEYLPLGKTTVQKLLQQKIIPATKIGRNYFITRKKLLLWIDENAGNEFNID